MTVVLVDCEKDSIFGYELLVFFENKSDQDLRFDINDVKANDKEVDDPYWLATLKAGTKAYVVLTLSESKAKEAGADPLTTISGTLVIKEADFFAEKAFYTEEFTFKVD